MKFQAYLGVSTECPENTIESIKAAAEQGYSSVAVKINTTADKQFVLLCDNSINRTARYADGSAIESPVYISDITYEQALGYDFGIGFSRKFKGETIPFLWDVLEFAVKSEIEIVIEKSGDGFFEEEQSRLFSLVKDYQGTVRLVCASLSELERSAKALPKASFCYCGETDRNTLEKISQTVPKSRLSVRLDEKSADEELCRTIKKYAELELGVICDGVGMEKAERLGADIVSTRGQIKPPANEGKTADMHTHSNHSHDCKVSLYDMREAQSKKCTDFVAVTNHGDIEFFKTSDAFGNIKRAEWETIALNAGNDSFSRLLVGAEIGDGVHRIAMMRYAERLCDYDVIIGSIHSTLRNGELVAYSRRDFSNESDEEIHAFMTAYFEDLKTLTEIGDFDILAHLTCPLRYVVGRYGKSVDMDRYRGIITEILKNIIKRGIALEVNTSSVSLALGDFVPSEDILMEYKELGGYLITLGSDAHIITEVSANFDTAKEHLKRLGFKDIYYFRKRRAYQCRLV